MNHYDDERGQTPQFLTNILAERVQFVRQAAKTTGFNMTVQRKAYGDYDQPNYVSVWTNEALSRNHGPFWREYERLVDAAKME